MRLVRAVDGLFESVAAEPDQWTDDRLAEWASDLSSEGEAPSKDAAKAIRAAIRNARKLRAYWADQTPPQDWSMAVDQALGGMGWEPSLRLAQIALEDGADIEAFEEVRRRFRMVNSVPWMEGVSFEEWQDQR